MKHIVFASLFLISFGQLLAQCPTSISANGSITSSCEGNDATMTISVSGVASVIGGTANPTPNLFIPDASNVGASSTITLTGGVGNILPTTQLSVLLNIPNNFNGDVDVFLVGPGNCGTMTLTTDNGGNSKNYLGTVLSPIATANITTGTGPFTDNFLPEGAVNVLPDLTGAFGGGVYTLPGNSLSGGGCPINGVWTLWVYDDAGNDSTFLDSWSLSIGPCQNTFTYNVTPPTTVSSNFISTNTLSALATLSNLPVGVSSVSTTVSNGTASTVFTAFTKVYAKPVITFVQTSPNCIIGQNGTIVINTPPINNANFTGSDIGFWEYSFNNGFSWQTSNTFVGAGAGSFIVQVRNSANPSCTVSSQVTLLGVPNTTQPTSVVQICEAETGATNTSITNQASGGPPGNVTFTQFVPCTSNCVVADGVVAIPPWTSTASITGTGAITTTSIVSVNLNINHTFVSDMDIWLVGPGNCGTLELSTDNGGSADNLTNITITTQTGFPSINTLPAAGVIPAGGTFLAENDLSTPILLSNPPNPSAPANGGNAYPVALAPYVPTTPLVGCPVNGTWTLVIEDDWGADIPVVLNWTLNITQSDPFYTHEFTTSEPGVTINPVGSFIGSGLNGFLGNAQILNLPIGITKVAVTATRGGCTSEVDTVTIKVYDRPVLDVAATSFSCASAGFPGCITLVALLNNADFTEAADLGVVQWSNSSSGPWVNLNGPLCGLAPGTYQYYLRNSASPGATGSGSCISGPYSVTVPNSLPVSIGLAPQTVTCSQQTVTLSPLFLTGSQTNNNYVWSTGPTTFNLAVTPTVNTTFCVTATSNVNNLCKDTACVTVNVDLTTPGPAPAAIGDSVCIAGNANLTGVGPCIGGVYQWFNVPTGGTPLGTGTVFTTFASSNSVFYVQCVQGPCITPRTAVNVTTFPAIPTPITFVSENPICSGVPVVLSVISPIGPLYRYQWFINGAAQGSPTVSPAFSYVPTNGQIITVKVFYYFD